MRCDICGGTMMLDERTEEEQEDDQECGVPKRQWVCFCDGGNYADEDD